MKSVNFTQKTIDRSGATIHYWTNGNSKKPAIFLLHGAAMDHEMFNAQYEALNDNYYIITWDARGHGESRPVQGTFNLQNLAEDCLAILDALTIQRVILIGQSEGGMIAQEVYRQQPERIAAMATVGASPIMLPYGKLDIWLLKSSTSIIKFWPYENFMKALAQKTAITQAARDYATRTVRAISKKDFLSIWDSVTSSLRHEGIPDMHITTPLLISYGDQDTTGTVKKNNRRWKQYEPNAELVVIPNAGHNANQDNASYFNNVLLSFLERVK